MLMCLLFALAFFAFGRSSSSSSSDMSFSMKSDRSPSSCEHKTLLMRLTAHAETYTGKPQAPDGAAARSARRS